MKTTIQEVLFDLYDILENNDLSDVEIDGFTEFRYLREFLEEQKDKLEAISEDANNE